MANTRPVRDRDAVYARNVRLAVIATLVALIVGFVLVRAPQVRPYIFTSMPAVELVAPLTKLFDIPEDPEPLPRQKQLVIDPKGKATSDDFGRNDWNPIITDVETPALVPVEFWRIERKPEQVYLHKPDYPDLARAAGIEGNATILIVIDTLGAVSSAEVLKTSGNTLLDAAARDAALLCRFTPGIQRDRPVPVKTSIPFKFRLD